MNKLLVIISFIAISILVGVIIYNRFLKYPPSYRTALNQNIEPKEEGGLTEELNPLSIEYMRKQEYPGSDIVIEQVLPPGSNYDRYIASYKSDGLKIFALLTIPQGVNPNRLAGDHL